MKKNAMTPDGKYEIIIYDDSSVTVKEIASNTKGTLRTIAKECNFEYDYNWNTRQFGNNIVDFLNKNKSTIITNQNEKVMKKIEVTIYGYEKELVACKSDEEVIESIGRFSTEDELTFEIEGKEYCESDFEETYCREDECAGVGDEVEAVEYFNEAGADIGMLNTNKTSCTFEIEIPENEEFDPHKVHLVCRDFIYPNDCDEPMLVAFVYDGKVYKDIDPQDSIGKDSEQIWPVYDDDDDDEDWSDDDEE